MPEGSIFSLFETLTDTTTTMRQDASVFGGSLGASEKSRTAWLQALTEASGTGNVLQVAEVMGPQAAPAISPAVLSTPTQTQAFLAPEAQILKAPSPKQGDMILQGLEKMRSVFDKQISDVAAATSAPMTDYRNLMTLQQEMTKFSLLVDVFSKLMGKATQTFDTLMKGQ